MNVPDADFFQNIFLHVEDLSVNYKKIYLG